MMTKLQTMMTKLQTMMTEVRAGMMVTGEGVTWRCYVAQTARSTDLWTVWWGGREVSSHLRDHPRYIWVVMPVVINSHTTIPDRELRFSFSRSRGPGGQNVNKVASRVTLRWSPATSQVLGPRQRAWLLERLAHRLTRGGELVVHAERYRTQERNRSAVQETLARTVRAALVRPKKRKTTKISAAAKRRRRDAKQKHSEKKQSRRARDWN